MNPITRHQAALLIIYGGSVAAATISHRSSVTAFGVLKSTTPAGLLTSQLKFKGNIMKTQHTPGPWRVGDAGHTVFGQPNGNPSPKTICTHISTIDDARLIAAAPDLLEALEYCLSMSKKEGVGGTSDRWYSYGEHTADIMRAAIAKATGGI